MGFLGAVAGSAAGALLSSTRGGTRPREHAIWMALGAAMGIEGDLLANLVPPSTCNICACNADPHCDCSVTSSTATLFSWPVLDPDGSATAVSYTAQ